MATRQADPSSPDTPSPAPPGPAMTAAPPAGTTPDAGRDNLAQAHTATRHTHPSSPDAPRAAIPPGPAMTAAPPADAAEGPGTDGARLVLAAEQAIRESVVDPRVAREKARRVLDEATARGHAEAAAVALRALALTARELGDLPLAESHLEEAIRVVGAPARRLAQARMSLVSVRTELGDPAGALRIAQEAEADLPGEDRAALAVQRAIALVRLGRHGEAVRLCDEALAGRAAPADPRFRCAALLNRGLALTYLGDHAAGAEDLAACLRIASDAGLDYVVTLAQANLSFNAARRGDIPAAFASFAAAEQDLAGYPERLAALRGDFAEALVAAHLPGEARALLHAAVPELAAAGALVHLAEARLFLAQVELLAGDPHAALATASLAREELAGQGRHPWVPLADDVAVRARLALEPAAPDLLGEVLACADALADSGWAATAAALRLVAARLAAGLGDRHIAETQLDRIIAACRAEPAARLSRSPHDRRPAAPDGHPATTERREPRLHGNGTHLEHAGCDSRGVEPAGRRATSTDGPAAVHGRCHELPWHEPPSAASSPRHGPGSSHRHAGSGGHGRGGETDLSPGRLSSRTLTLVFHHAVALRRRLAGDHAGALAAIDAGLRAVDGREAPSDIRAHAARPAEELAELGLELALHTGDPAAVLAWAERWRACVRGEPPGPFPADRLRRTLGDAVLVELVRHGDALAAVVVTGPGCALYALGSYRAAVEATVRLRYCLRRRGLRDAGAGDGILRAAAELSALLLDPLARDLADGPVVIVPTGALHTVPWPMLPPLRGRPVCIAPSAAAWLAAITDAPADHAMSAASPPAPGLAGRLGVPPTLDGAARRAPLPEEPPVTAGPPVRSPSAAPPVIATPTADRAREPLFDQEPGRASAQEPAAQERAAAHDHTSLPATPHPDHGPAAASGSGLTAAPAEPAAAAPASGGPTAGPSRVSSVLQRASVIAVAGPGLAHAEAEVAMVLGTHRGAVRVPARTDAVLEALRVADVVHLAAHGMFCPHTPLLSSITLDDGPLMAYDLLRLDRTPRLVVLSACESGLAHTPVDGAPLGLAGTFLDRGTTCVVAGLVPVRDDEALTLMTEFHRLLATGATPAEALAAATEATAIPGFACLGAGPRTALPRNTAAQANT